MNRIEEFCQTLCPDGVKYVPLKNLVKKFNGIPITAGKMKTLESNGGGIRIFAGGKTYVDTNDPNYVSAANSGPAIIVKSRGNIDFDFWSDQYSHKNELWSYYDANEETDIKFIYYYLRLNSRYFQALAKTKSVKLPQISASDTDNFMIPVPPLKIQKEIVFILDKLSSLELDLKSQLMQELDNRSKQFTYYKNRLFEFESDKIKLSDICTSFSGSFVKKTSQSDSFSYPVYNGGANPTGYFGQFNAEANSIAISARGSMGFVNWVKQRFWAGNSCHVLTVKSDSVNSEYLYHYLKVHESDLINLGRLGSIPALNLEPLMNFEVKIPSLDHQLRILERMSNLNKLSKLLVERIEEELNARKKQYEYYLDKLLTFKKLEPA